MPKYYVDHSRTFRRYVPACGVFLFKSAPNSCLAELVYRVSEAYYSGPKLVAPCIMEPWALEDVLTSCQSTELYSGGPSCFCAAAQEGGGPVVSSKSRRPRPS
eukprot:3101916-Pleurochrysis_carterae.AAC.4